MSARWNRTPWSRALWAKTMLLTALCCGAVSGQAMGGDETAAKSHRQEFCNGASFVPLDRLMVNRSQFLDKRVQTHAVLRTDGKEYTRISLEENSGFSMLLTADAESTAYFHAHPDIVSHYVNVVDDLFSKMQSMGVPKAEREMSKISFYRQEVTVCGRLVGDQNEVQFAVDDQRVERTYMLPWRNSGKR